LLARWCRDSKWTRVGLLHVRSALLLLNVTRLKRSSKLDNAVLPMSAQDQTSGGRDKSGWARTALVHERHRLRAAHVASLTSFEPEASALDQGANRAIEMATASHPLPHRRQPILPPHHIQIRGSTVFNEQKTPTWFEDAAHFVQPAAGIRNGTQRPGRYN